MGLSNHLTDASTDSIPILLVISAATWVSYLRSLLLLLLRPLGLFRPSSDPMPAAVGSSLAGLVVLADHLASNRPFSYSVNPSSSAAGDACIFCLSSLEDGDSIRRLSCCHVFHAECLDGWFDRMNLSCPLCRSPLVADERRADADRRIGAELVAWLSPY